MAVTSFNFFDRIRLVALSLGWAFAFLVMCFAARVADWAGDYTPSAYGFIVFNAVFSLLLTSVLLAAPWLHGRTGAAFFRRCVEPLAEAGVTGVLTVFWFSGFIAVAVARPRNCPTAVCGVARAAIAFAFFSILPYGILFGIRLRDVIYRYRHPNDFSSTDKFGPHAAVHHQPSTVESQPSPLSGSPPPAAPNPAYHP
ncbi:hypothetical protein H4R35_001773 [Dimargaris xerosporica]|nr:hypothetical protein H4R35_001773 [Dimargaris xerosporica]